MQILSLLSALRRAVFFQNPSWFVLASHSELLSPTLLSRLGCYVSAVPSRSYVPLCRMQRFAAEAFQNRGFAMARALSFGNTTFYKD